MLEKVLLKWGAKNVEPFFVYNDIFDLEFNEKLQEKNESKGNFKTNPVGYYAPTDKYGKPIRKKGRYRILFKDTFKEDLKVLQNADFAILNGLTFYGRKNTMSNASKLYAMIFDIDGVTETTLNTFLKGAFSSKFTIYPLPNYIVLSGHNIHLYYVFEQPIPLFPNLKLQLKDFKYALTEKMWNMYTSTEKHKQFQGIHQGFRVIGGKTKIDGVVTRAFQLNTHPFSLNNLNEYVPEEKRIDENKLFQGKLSLEEARVKYPEWYEKVVINKDSSIKKWDINKKVNGNNPFALYDWWRQKILTGATYGHRYFNIMCLVIYAVKCGVPYEKVKKDSLDFVSHMNTIGEEPFNEEDVYSALECYDERYCTFPIKDIEKISGIQIKKNKRNGRKQATHIQIMNSTRDILYPNKEWINRNGRPKGSGTKEKIIKDWKKKNPDKKKIDCCRALKIDPKTIRKWWD